MISVPTPSPSNRPRAAGVSRWRPLRGSGGLRILAAVAGGLSLYAATAPRTWWWAAIAGFALLGASLYGRRPRVAAGLSFLAGAAYFVPLLRWSGVYVGAVPWFGLALAEAALVIPAGWLIAAASRRLPLWPVFAAAGWVFGEALRARFPFGGFPWGAIAFSQADGPLLPIAALLGSVGLTFGTALAGFALTELGRSTLGPTALGRSTLGRRTLDPGALDRSTPRRRGGATSSAAPAAPAAPAATVAAVAAAGMLALPFLAGLAGRAAEHSTASDPQQRIAIIQGNVPRLGLDFNAQRRAVLDNHAARTHELAAAVRAGTEPAPTFVIWPENASDIDPYVNADAAAVISAAARDVGVPILVGAIVTTSDPYQSYNEGIVWDPETGPGDSYAKRHPVPFGEYMPWRGFFRIFSDKVDLIRGAFLPGTEPGNLDVAGVQVGDLICFEVVEDGLVRDVVNGGARVIVVQTNNATFGFTDETWQQQAMSRVRAVEHGRDVLIAATSGVSAVIRSDGTVESTIGLFTPGYLVPSVGMATTTTPGTVLGEPLEWALVVSTPLALLIVAVPAVRRHGHRRSQPSD